MHGGVLHCLKGSFDERHRRLAPGLVLILSMIERAFDDPEIAAIDLCGCDDPWKRKFATDEVRKRTVRVARAAPVPAGMFYAHRAGRAAKRAMSEAMVRMSARGACVTTVTAGVAAELAPV